MKRTVLVTGGAGYIGSHVALQLLESGYQVVVLDNLSSGTQEMIPSDCHFYQGSVGDKLLIAQIAKLHQPQAVLHFAASVAIKESVENPSFYYQNNFLQSLRLFEACVENGIEQIVFSSTAATYGIPSKPEVNEGSETNPFSPYGRSKLMAEWALKDLANIYPLRYVILRYFNVAGARTDLSLGQVSLNANHLIKIAVEVACGTRNSVSIFGNDYSTPDGTGVRDYIHIQDLADAHCLALRHLEAGKKSELFNCGYGRGYSVKEVLRAVAEISGKTLPTKVVGRRPGDVPSLIAVSERIRNTLGWQPKFDDLLLICKTAYHWELKRSIWSRYMHPQIKPPLEIHPTNH